MARVLVTGGSGFLGINLVRYLLAKGHEVNVLDVVDFSYDDCKKDVNFYLGSVTNAEQVKQAMMGCKFVVHAAAALPLYSDEEVMRTNVKGTEIVMQTAKSLGIFRVVYISSTAVYGVPEKIPVLETDQVVGVGTYGQSKIIAEKICLDYRKGGMCVPIIRPKSFVGPERLGVFAIFFEWVKDGKNFPMIGDGKNKYQLLDVDDLCDAIYLCLAKDVKDVNATFNIGAEVFLTMREDYQAVMNWSKSKKKIVNFPKAPVLMTLRGLNKVNMSPLYPWIYETAFKDSIVSVDWAKERLGWKAKYSNSQALIRSYKWYLNNYSQLGQGTGVSHRKPWKQGVLKAMKLFF